MDTRIAKLARCALALVALYWVCAAQMLLPTSRAKPSPSQHPPVAARRPLSGATPIVGVEEVASTLEETAGVWLVTWPDEAFYLALSGEGNYDLWTAGSPLEDPVQSGRIWFEDGILRLQQTRTHLNGHGPDGCTGFYQASVTHRDGCAVAMRLQRISDCFTGPLDMATGPLARVP